MKHYVYLAGPITGLTLAGCTDWRKAVAAQLDSSEVKCLTPLRGKAFLAKEKAIGPHAYDGTVTSSKGVTRRDMFDTLRSTCLFVNLLGTPKASIGTCMELAWAYQNQIPTIVVMEEDNVHRHVMVDEACTYRVGSIDEGVRLTKFLLAQEEHQQ